MSNTIKEITVEKLHQLIKEKEDFQLIDVREEAERKRISIGGKLIPLRQIRFNLNKISKEKKVVIYCHSGRRSANAIAFLQEATGAKNLYNLKGGLLEWAAKIVN